ncbi:MAG TPA: peptide ABC transporter substrate-binding protein [Thermodesulfobacteriota bacterium]
MRRIASTLAAVLAAALLVPSPGLAASVFRISNMTEPETLDPALASGVPEHRIISSLFEGLYANDPKDLSPVPGVALRHTLSKDGTVYTFTLNPQARWTNGRQVTADDFVYAWERVLNPKTGAKYAQQLYYVKNGEAYNRGTITDFGLVGVKALNQTTLQVTLERPTAYFLYLTTFYTLYPVPKEAVERHGADWTKPGRIVSNGPFRLVEWVPQQTLVLEKNPGYWDAGSVALDRVVFDPTTDVNTVVRQFQAGETDWVTSSANLPAALVAVWKDRPEYYAEPYLGTYYFRMNVTRPPLNDVRVRKALSMAIDREALTRSVTRAGEIASSAFVPRNMPNYSGVKGLDFDPAEAKRLLAEAGYPGGKGFPPVELMYNTNELHRIITQALQQMWKRHLGIEVTLTNVEWKVYLARMKALDYQIARAGWIGDYVDPNTFLDMWVTGGGNNQTGWANARYDALIRKAAETVDPEARMKTLREAETVLVREELPIAPVFTYVSKGLIRRSFDGFHPNILDQHPLKAIRPR